MLFGSARTEDLLLQSFGEQASASAALRGKEEALACSSELNCNREALPGLSLLVSLPCSHCNRSCAQETAFHFGIMIKAGVHGRCTCVVQQLKCNVGILLIFCSLAVMQPSRPFSNAHDQAAVPAVHKEPKGACMRSPASLLP